MAKLKFEIITAEKIVYTDEVDVVIAPGSEGQLGILPQHAALMTMLQPGELMVKKGNEEDSMFVSGGFMEVCNNKVIVLADTAERAEDIDTERAGQAKARAENIVSTSATDVDLSRARASMLRSLTRLKVAEKSKKRRPR